MEAKEVILTYETLYETLRREKAKPELQKVEDTFVQDALIYLTEKQQAYDDNLAKDDIFSQGERDKLGIQLTNIKKILRDIYDVRERKIINMAINQTRTGAHIVDAEHLLRHERQLFDNLCQLLTQYRTGVLHKLLEQRQPDITPLVLPKPEELQTAPPEPPKTKHVKFTDNIDQFVGEELEQYGPYEQDDEAILPAKLADILINEGKAVQVE